MEGQRLEKKPGGAKKGLLIAAAVVGVLATAYLGLCAWVGSQQTIFPHVSVLGLDVSGMTAEQAEDSLARAADEAGDEVSVTLRSGSWQEVMTADQLEVDWAGLARTAQGRGREHFLTQGAAYLAALAGREQSVGLPTDSGEEQAALSALLDRADGQAGNGVIQASYRVEGEELVMTRGTSGMAVDREAVVPAVMDAFEQAFAQHFETGGAGSASVELVMTSSAPQEPDFDAIHQALYTQVRDAAVDPETYQVSDHAVGVDFDPDELRQAYEQAREGETFSFPLTVTQPGETRERLEAKLFRDLLGEGTTRVTGSSNRKFNVKLSAEACNGVVLMPGEEFSYNNTTGSRSADKGYLAAPVYSDGASVDEVGGGICQTSSTIYYAVLHTTLEVVERHAHTYNTGYVTQGMDATVYYGKIDFRFKNNTGYPIKIVTESYDKNGSRYLNVKIYGTNLDGTYAVPKSSVFDRVDPTTQYKADESVPQGTTKVDSKQNAYIGWSAQTYRYIYDKDGNLLEKQDMGFSRYKMRPKTILYNPADGDPATWVDGQPPQPGTTDPGTGTTDPGTGTTEPGTGTTDPGAGTTDPGAGTTDPGAGTTEPGTGTTDPGAGTTDPGAGTTDPGAGTIDPGAGTTEPGTGTTDPDTGAETGGSPEAQDPAAGSQTPSGSQAA